MFKKLLLSCSLLLCSILSFAQTPYWQIRIDPISKDATAYMLSYMYISTGVGCPLYGYIDNKTGIAAFTKLFAPNIQISTTALQRELDQLVISSGSQQAVIAQLQIDSATLANILNDKLSNSSGTVIAINIANLQNNTSNYTENVQFGISTATLVGVDASKLDASSGTTIAINISTLQNNTSNYVENAQFGISTGAIVGVDNTQNIDIKTLQDNTTNYATTSQMGVSSTTFSISTGTLVGVDNANATDIKTLQDNTTNYVDNTKFGITTHTILGLIAEVKVSTPTGALLQDGSKTLTSEWNTGGQDIIETGDIYPVNQQKDLGTAATGYHDAFFGTQGIANVYFGTTTNTNSFAFDTSGLDPNDHKMIFDFQVPIDFYGMADVRFLSSHTKFYPNNATNTNQVGLVSKRFNYGYFNNLDVTTIISTGIVMRDGSTSLTGDWAMGLYNLTGIGNIIPGNSIANLGSETFGWNHLHMGTNSNPAAIYLGTATTLGDNTIITSLTSVRPFQFSGMPTISLISAWTDILPTASPNTNDAGSPLNRFNYGYFDNIDCPIITSTATKRIEKIEADINASTPTYMTNSSAAANYVQYAQLGSTLAAYVKRDGSTPLTGDWNVGGYKLSIDTITESTPGFGLFLDRVKLHYAGMTGSAAPTLTDNGNGTVTVGAGTAMLYDTANFTGGLWKKSISQATLTPTNNELSYVVVNWNSGSPEYQILTLANRANITQSDIIPVFRLFRTGNALEYSLSYGQAARGLPNKESHRVNVLRGIETESGFGLTESNTMTTLNSSRTVVVGSGYMWFGTERYSCESFTSSDSARCKMNIWTYLNGSWMEFSTTVYNNLWYQTATSTGLVNASRIVTNWVYRNIATSEVDILLGENQNDNLATALTRTEPTNKPPALSYFYKLIGRIMVIRSADTTQNTGSIQAVTSTMFTQAFDSDHTHLTNIGVNTHAEIDTAITTFNTLATDVNVSTGANKNRVDKIEADINSSTNTITTNARVSSTTLAGVDTSLGVSTNTNKTRIDKLESDVNVSTGSNKLRVDKIEADTNVSTNSLVNFHVGYSTRGPVMVIFGSTDAVAGNLVGMTADLDFATDVILKVWCVKANNDISGSVNVEVSSGAFGLPYGVIDAGASPKLVSNTISSGTTSGWATAIGGGGCVRLRVTSATSVKQISVGLVYWRIKD